MRRNLRISVGRSGPGTQAATGSGDKPVYVALDAPCRVADTRPGDDNVGVKNTPISAGEANAYEVQITGANGECTANLAVPADAVAVALNVTAIAPQAPTTGRSFFTVYPANASLPTTSNLNFVSGQPPVPNKVDVGLSPTGRIKIFNAEGTAHAAVDIFGYYIDHHHDDRYYTESETDGKLGTKANTTDVYNKAEVDGKLGTKANTTDVYNKAEVDGKLGTKANTTDVYTKAEVDGALAGVAGVDYSRTDVFVPVDDSVNVLESIVIDAPEPGIVVVTASAWANQDSTGVSLRCGLSTSSSAFQGDQSANQYLSTTAQFTISMTRGFEVGAGQTIIYFLCRRDNPGTDYSIGERNMTAVYSVNRP